VPFGKSKFDASRSAQDIVEYRRLIERRNQIEREVEKLRDPLVAAQAGDQNRVFAKRCLDAQGPIFLSVVGHVACSPRSV
jgi:hypothetical protein